MPKKVKTVPLRKIVELILDTDREVFRVRFIKRSTGEVRTMLAMRGVTEYLKGGELPYEASENVDRFSLFCNDCLKYISAIDDDDFADNIFSYTEDDTFGSA